MARRAAEPLDAEFLRARLSQLAGRDVANQRFGVAVSGGADSSALLILAAEALAGRVEAATVDHGLRPEAVHEAAEVHSLSSRFGVPHQTLSLEAPLSSASQASARDARYAALERWRAERSLDWVLTAHHADDQLETILMRLDRGSGLSGLSGIRARNGTILRPLLGRRRSELEALCRERSVDWVEDPANADPRHDRSRMRQALVALGEAVDRHGAARSADALHDADTALAWVTEELARDRLVANADTLEVRIGGLPRDLQRRLLLRALASFVHSQLRGETVGGAIDRLNAGVAAMVGDVLIHPQPSGEVWRLTPAPPRNGK